MPPAAAAAAAPALPEELIADVLRAFDASLEQRSEWRRAFLRVRRGQSSANSPELSGLDPQRSDFAERLLSACSSSPPWPTVADVDSWRRATTACLAELDLMAIPLATAGRSLGLEKVEVVASPVGFEEAAAPGPQTLEQFRSRLATRDTLCFSGSSALTKDPPEPKQDRHDLQRDVLQLNGELVQADYDRLVRRVMVLLPAPQDSDAFVAASHLLHLCNRTLTGAHCLDAVLAACSHPDVHVVPLSSAASPLQLVVETDVAHVGAQLSYAVVESAETADHSNAKRVAEVEAKFLATVGLRDLRDPRVLEVTRARLLLRDETPRESAESTQLSEPVPEMHWRTYLKFRPPSS